MKPAALRLLTVRILRSLGIPLFSLLIASICLIVSAGPVALGQRSKPTQYDVEAAYLVQFPKFVQWPPFIQTLGGPKSFDICVLGSDPYGRILQEDVAGEKIEGLPLVARQVRSASSVAGCRVLFLSSSESAQIAEDLDQIKGISVLTVSELPDFTLRGGMIEFVLMGHRVRFRINMTNMEQAGLVASSQLLKVAAAVDRNPGNTR